MLARVSLWIASLRKEDGQTAVEYGVLLALILAISIGVITAVGLDVQAAFQDVVDALPGGGGGGGS
jgi:pilus assembly protein Flp/PilA